MASIALTELSDQQREQLAAVAYRAAQQHAPDWLPDLTAAREEIRDALEPDVYSRVTLDPGGNAIGYAAVKHSYGRLWELHPLVVDPDHQGHGHGKSLVMEIEKHVAARGGLTLWVGTSDETNATSLHGVDLYDDPIGALQSMVVHGRHSTTFWQHIGYRIVGFAPDAEGYGRPTIHLAKRVAPPAPETASRD